MAVAQIETHPLPKCLISQTIMRNRATILLLLLPWCAHAQTATPSTPAVPVADQRATPRSALFGYLEACRENDFRRAASFLNLEHARFRNADGPDLAQQLKEVLDRRLSGNPGLLSNNPAGDQTDGLDPDYELVGTVHSGGKSVDILLERVSRDGNHIWLISSATVHNIQALHDNLGSTWAEQHLPRWMQTRGPVDTDVWQWFAMALLAIVAAAIAALLARITAAVVAPILRHTPSTADDELVVSVVPPLQLLLALALFHGGLGLVGPPVLLRTYILGLLTALAYIGIAWFAVRLIDIVTAQLERRMELQSLASARSMLPLGRRTAKMAAVTVAILATLSSWGYNTTAILAGLGVGGLAVALAAQKTIENLFGGVAITTDRPILVGDFCRYGDKAGTVEDIGLRSTRIRTLDRTLVTIPNAQFSSLMIENFAVRDKIFFNPKLSLRNTTTPEQMRAIIPAIRGVLLNHTMVDPNPARVRFIAIGQWSFDIEVFAYVKTANFDEFLVVQEELFLSILDEIAKAGTALAIPTQLNVSAYPQVRLSGILPLRSRSIRVPRNLMGRRLSLPDRAPHLLPS